MMTRWMSLGAAHRTRSRTRSTVRAVALAAATVLAGCGGGDYVPVGGSCSLVDQQLWLQSYMDDWYFWYAISPSPSPSGYAGLDTYFNALLYTGTDPNFPADRWSGFESTESFNRFFGDGNILGYGMRVAGLEVSGLPDQPLLVRYIDPGSPAAAAGLVRGDEVLALNGRPASELISLNDFSALAPVATTDSLTAQILDAQGATRTVTLPAAIYAVAPVPASAVVPTSVSGRPMGYLQVNDMISQAGSPMAAAFSSFKSSGVQEVVIDLRYNGGGLVSVADDLGSYVAGARASGQVFSSLAYNDKRAAANNQSFYFTDFSSALGLSRVYVLTGARTCSASEQVINGLRPFVDVVSIGDTTCGKPVGFLPQSYCGTTYSVVNFESTNSRNEGRYFDGFAPTCAVAEDFSQPIGGAGDPLLNAARDHADTGACPATAMSKQRLLGVGKTAAKAGLQREPGERQTMIAR